MREASASEALGDRTRFLVEGTAGATHLLAAEFAQGPWFVAAGFNRSGEASVMTASWLHTQSRSDGIARTIRSPDSSWRWRSACRDIARIASANSAFGLDCPV